MIYTFLKKYHLSIEEYYDLAAIGLCKASSNFDDNKSKFSTYAYQCMFTEVFREIRDKKAAKRVQEHQIVYYQANVKNDDTNIFTFLENIPSKDNVEEETLLKVVFDDCINKLKDRDKQILILLSNGYTQNEIGEVVGCSQSQISKQKKKICKYLA